MKLAVDKVRQNFAMRLNIALNQFTDCPAENHAGRTSYLGNLFKVSSQNARRWLKGQHMPESVRLEEVADRLNIRLDWLMTGRGVMGDSLPGDDVQFTINPEVMNKVNQWMRSECTPGVYDSEVFDPELLANIQSVVYHLVDNGETSERISKALVELTAKSRIKNKLVLVSSKD